MFSPFISIVYYYESFSFTKLAENKSCSHIKLFLLQYFLCACCFSLTLSQQYILYNSVIYTRKLLSAPHGDGLCLKLAVLKSEIVNSSLIAQWRYEQNNFSLVLIMCFHWKGEILKSVKLLREALIVASAIDWNSGRHHDISLIFKYKKRCNARQNTIF